MGDVRTIKKNRCFFFFFTVAIFCYILFLHFLKLFRLVLRSCVIHRLIIKIMKVFAVSSMKPINTLSQAILLQIY